MIETDGEKVLRISAAGKEKEKTLQRLIPQPWFPASSASDRDTVRVNDGTVMSRFQALPLAMYKGVFHLIGWIRQRLLISPEI